MSRRRHDVVLPSCVVDRVDDPTGHVRLVRVIGAVDTSCLSLVFDTWSDVTTSWTLHLDLHDAVIVGDVAMQTLERALDHLERRGIGVRIVGIDPQHPAIAG